MKMKFFELAKTLSKKSDHYQHKIGSVLVKKNRIISVGWNMLKTHPQSPHKFKSCHSEFNTILGVPMDQLRGSTIYVYRETKDGIAAKARPCVSCFNLIRSVGIERVCYTDNSCYFEEII